MQRGKMETTTLPGKSLQVEWEGFAAVKRWVCFFLAKFVCIREFNGIEKLKNHATPGDW